MHLRGVRAVPNYPWQATFLGCAVAGVVFTALGVWVLAHEVQMWRWRRDLVALELRLPRTVTTTEIASWVSAVRSIMRARRWWSLLAVWPLCIEVTATADGIRRVLVVPQRLRGDVLATVSAVLPGARLDQLEGYVTQRPPRRLRVAVEARVRGGGVLLGVDRADAASLHLLAALQPLEAGEWVRLQWVITGARPPRWVVTATEPAMVPAHWSQKDPVIRAACRVVVSSRFGRRRAHVLFGRVWAALRHMNTTRAGVARRRFLPRFVVSGRLVSRAVPYGRWPVTATSSELAGLLGLVAALLPGVPPAISRTLPAPRAASKQGVPIAASNYPGSGALLRLAPSDRLRHVWMVGPTGAGKSTLLTNMITHDMNTGDTVIVVDARGDLAFDVLDRVPGDRANDVVLIDPTLGGHITGVNPLCSGPPEQAAALVFHVLHSIYAGSWGPRTADIVRATLLTLTSAHTHDGDRFTLMEVPELLTNSAFRRTVTSQVTVPQLAAFWKWYDGMGEAARLNTVSPVLNKLRAFTLSTPMRRMLGQSDGVNFDDMLAEKRIVVVPLKRGKLGAEATSLMGSLIIAAVWQATLARADIPADNRPRAWLYVDEFQDVVRLPLDLADMLAQARGLGLGLTLAHQYLAQLTPQVKTAVRGTARSHIMFQLGQADAKDLAAAFTPLTADDLAHLGAYEVAMRPCIGGATAPPVTGATFPMVEATTDGRALAKASAARYGMAPADIEASLLARVQTPGRHGTRGNRIPRSELS
jgi:hypothetical protein